MGELIYKSSLVDGFWELLIDILIIICIVSGFFLCMSEKVVFGLALVLISFVCISFVQDILEQSEQLAFVDFLHQQLGKESKMYHCQGLQCIGSDTKYKNELVLYEKGVLLKKEKQPKFKDNQVLFYMQMKDCILVSDTTLHILMYSGQSFVCVFDTKMKTGVLLKHLQSQLSKNAIL